MKMDKPISNFHFKAMTLIYRVRDFIYPRKRVLEEAGIEPGFQVLDFGCGPGGYVRAAAELVGKGGKVYALDMKPLAIEMVEGIVSREHLQNVETILSDCRTGLPDESMDVVLLYDILHMLSEPDAVLQELRRVLKAEGVLSVSDHHLGDKLVGRITGTGLFDQPRKGKKVYNFSKAARA
jgi:ubiquinone/menaquinone biosynthesis C-methylase UbiE